ncbi:MAG: hypothetical protein ACREMA_02240 [Longimicrobiales bacterium]
MARSKAKEELPAEEPRLPEIAEPRIGGSFTNGVRDPDPAAPPKTESKEMTDAS